MVQVVSMEEVTMRLGEGVFHENEVSGAGGDLVFFEWARTLFSLSEKGSCPPSCCPPPPT